MTSHLQPDKGILIIVFSLFLETQTYTVLKIRNCLKLPHICISKHL